MPCTCLSGTYPNIPAATPVPGDPYDETIVGVKEAAFRRGEMRDPQPDKPHVDDSVAGYPPPDRNILMRVVGWGRPSRDPVPTPTQHRPMTGNLSAGVDGSHVEFGPPIAAEVPQGMAPQAVIKGNTYRQPPAPSDQNVILGRLFRAS